MVWDVTRFLGFAAQQFIVELSYSILAPVDLSLSRFISPIRDKHLAHNCSCPCNGFTELVESLLTHCFYQYLIETESAHSHGNGDRPALLPSSSPRRQVASA